MIRIRGLGKRFGERRVLEAIDADVAEGQCVAIVGPSGCGKSTLLRCLNGLEPFDEGVADVSGFLLAAGVRPDREKLRALRTAVGMVFQELQLFPHLTAIENVALAPRVVAPNGRSSALSSARELLARVGLGERVGAYPHELSGGQRQRVAIARALAMPLRVLLLDEPTSALDPGMRGEVRDVLQTLARETSLTIVLVTHDARLADELADCMWIMKEGRIVARGTPSQVLTSVR
ncbi:MAG: amino acid ABC transporter ATP-binding protein [Myxococcota bacterium]|nr:amino acid ABC transporter ATP-binding protein [Myxococcota bacterium]